MQVVEVALEAVERGAAVDATRRVILDQALDEALDLGRAAVEPEGGRLVVGWRRELVNEEQRRETPRVRQGSPQVCGLAFHEEPIDRLAAEVS